MVYWQKSRVLCRPVNKDHLGLREWEATVSDERPFALFCSHGSPSSFFFLFFAREGDGKEQGVLGMG